MSDRSHIAEINAEYTEFAPVSLGYGYWQWRRYAFFASFYGYYFYYGKPNKQGAGPAA